MEYHELLYKKYNGLDTPKDYVSWAEEMLYFDSDEMKKLASMRPPFSAFEIEEMFEHAVRSLGWAYPTELECAMFHMKRLHQQLLFASDDVVDLVRELYHCAIQYKIEEKQLQWHEPSEWVDQLEYDEAFDLSKEMVGKKIIQHARELWHAEKSEYTFSALVGQRVIGVDVKTTDQFTIQFENGRLFIECAWRIRTTETILLGDAEIRANAVKWQDVQELLVNRMIQDIQFWTNCPFLIVQFDELFLDVFQSSSLVEGWSITDDEDRYLFPNHDGQLT
ncbi:hypothetical protein CSV79_05850 [Sporosarcina sp. P13]|uniref:hypothetical protein n=1 Tax=Sporosarcina sp. P13 TaxID=2048263 RepID=UPI000C166799|nr:hypothetical protein [Sporosarcina sp. P13]PIC64662.1 hypothetical protein CSV79_05850 [Sporosarcina sp. P13]